jgi:hypothetical protein
MIGSGIVSLDFNGGQVSSRLEQWLPRAINISLVNLPFDTELIDVTIELWSGPRSLYQGFPFNCYIGAKSGVGEYTEVNAEEHSFVAEVRNVQVLRGRAQLCFFCEDGGVPAQVGMGPDLASAMMLNEVVVRVAAYQTGASIQENLVIAPWSVGLRDVARPPVFVIGPYRSGTSITTWAIGQHPNIAPMEETGWVSSSLVALKAAFRLANRREKAASFEYDLPESEYLRTLAHAINELHLKLARRRARRLNVLQLATDAPPPALLLERSRWAPKNRWVDGTPEYTLNGRDLADSFDDSQFVLMVRNPANVLRSLAYFDRAGVFRCAWSNRLYTGANILRRDVISFERSAVDE